MNVSLTPDLDVYVAEKLSAGGYNSASEVVREALRLLQARDSQLHSFNSALVQRMEGLNRGERITPAQLKQNMNKFTAQKKLKA